MNPELTRWTGPQGLPRFDLIGDSDFAPAFDRELAAASAALTSSRLNLASTSVELSSSDSI